MTGEVFEGRAIERCRKSEMVLADLLARGCKTFNSPHTLKALEGVGGERLSVLSAGLLGDGAVSTGGGAASGSAEGLGNEDVSLIGGSEEQPGTPDGLGDDVEDGKEEDLFVRVELASSLAKGESDGVEGPNDNESERNLVVETANLGAAEEGGGAARGDELEEDPGEGGTGEGEEAPLASLGRVDTSNDTSDNHDFVGKDEDDDLSDGEASKKGEVEEEERGGQGPVDVCFRAVRRAKVACNSQPVVVVKNRSRAYSAEEEKKTQKVSDLFSSQKAIFF